MGCFHSVFWHQVFRFFWCQVFSSFFISVPLSFFPPCILPLHMDFLNPCDSSVMVARTCNSSDLEESCRQVQAWYIDIRDTLPQNIFRKWDFACIEFTQVLCMQSQLLWVHICNHSVVSSPPVLTLRSLSFERIPNLGLRILKFLMFHALTSCGSVLISIYCKKKPLGWGLRDALILCSIVISVVGLKLWCLTQIVWQAFP